MTYSSFFYSDFIKSIPNNLYTDHYGDDIESYTKTTLKLINDLTKHINKDDTLFEIGSGNGIAIHYLNLLGYECSGFDKAKDFEYCYKKLDIEDKFKSFEITKENWIEYINSRKEDVIFSLRFFVFDRNGFEDDPKYIKNIRKKLFLQVSDKFSSSKPNIYDYMFNNARVINTENNSFLL